MSRVCALIRHPTFKEGADRVGRELPEGSADDLWS